MSTLPAAQVPLWAPLYGASPAAAVQRFFRKYAAFTGRASRSEFWWWALANAVVISVLYATAVICLFAGSGEDEDGVSHAGPAVGLGLACFGLVGLWVLGTIVPGIALTVRRLHDANFSGLLALLGLIPYVGGLVLLVFDLLPSNPLGRRFDAPDGVPVWQTGMPYFAFPAAPGEPDRSVALPPAFAVNGTYGSAEPYAPAPAYPQFPAQAPSDAPAPADVAAQDDRRPDGWSQPGS